MKSFVPTVAVIIALVSMVQYCPAPAEPFIAALVSGTWGGITGGLIAHENSKRNTFIRMVRRDDPFPNAPQPAGNKCKQQLESATVNFAPAGDGAFTVNDLPSACMTLANVFNNNNQDGGTATLKYINMSQDQISRIQSAIKAQQNSS